MSSARPTYASSTATVTENDSLYGTYDTSSMVSSLRTIPTSDSTITAKLTPTSTPVSFASASASGPVSRSGSVMSWQSVNSHGATVGTTSDKKSNSVWGKGNSISSGSVNGSIAGGKGKQKMGTDSKGKGKANVPEVKVRTKPRTWDEMVDDDDGSELGSVMDFGR